jgi:predicted DNA-binding transcriptional regulator AlpA
MGVVIPVDFRREWPWLSKREIAQKLGRSVRWVELRTAEGLPSELIGIRRMYRESEVRNWLAREEARVG